MYRECECRYLRSGGQPYRAPRDGIVQCVNALVIGRGITALGGGRETMEDVVDPSVGFTLETIPGTRVKHGDVLAMILAKDDEGVGTGNAVLDEAIVIGDAPVTLSPLISHRVTTAGVEKL